MDDLETQNVLKGLVDVVVDYTKISFIDGHKGVLYYRGYPIEQLTENAPMKKLPSSYYLGIYRRRMSYMRLTNF